MGTIKAFHFFLFLNKKIITCCGKKLICPLVACFRVVLYRISNLPKPAQNHNILSTKVIVVPISSACQVVILIQLFPIGFSIYPLDMVGYKREQIYLFNLAVLRFCGFQILLDVHSGHTTGRCCGYCLLIVPVVNITSGKDPLDRGL